MKTFLVVLLVGLVAAKSKVKLNNKRQFSLSFGTQAPSGVCTGDKLDNCASYTTSVCSNSDYTKWVQDNCCAFCGGGGGAPSIPSGGSMTGGSMTGGSCTDKLTNCADYTSSVCSDSSYSGWVTENCAAFCGKCGGTSSGSGNPMPIVSGGGSCSDSLANCADYGKAVCTNADYASWVKTNCQSYCGQCGSSTGTMTGGMTGTGTGGSGPSASFCMDKLDCKSYSPDICTNTDYAQWAKENCPATCNMCGGGGGTMTGTGTGTGTMTGTGTGTMTGTCSDKLTNCGSYDPSVCTSTDYAQWAKDNCAKTCNKCSGTTSTGGSGPMLPPISTGTGGAITGQSSGCVYSGQVYQQGQTWKDGCKFSCSCTDGATGKYTCNQLCVTWNLPQQCSMNPPAAGKCCPTPNCPAGFNIQYPPGYTAQ